MSPAHVLEPTYSALRRRLLTGVWPPGFRLEAARLADELGVSITPVRDSLNRLTGERLVHSSPGEGFQVPHLDETEFRTLLDWHHAVVDMALRWPGGVDRAVAVPAGRDGVAERTALLFGVIASAAGNAELDWTLANIAAKLGRYRRTEKEVLPDSESELGEMEALIEANRRAPLTGLVERYHDRRRDAAALVIHAARKGR